MIKKTATIFLSFFLCISFLQADSFLKEDVFHDFLIPFETRELHTVPSNSGDPFIDTLIKFADHLGERLNGTILIARHDTVLVEKSYGYLQLYKTNQNYCNLSMNDLETLRMQKSNAMTNNTAFDLASVSKQFTAAAILKLCYEGKLSLKDSLKKYFPGIPYGNVTIKQMLSHNSGLPEYFNFPYTTYDTTPFITNDYLVEVLKNNKVQWFFRPGQGYTYTNTNYALLASIVAQVSGMHFEQYVRDYLWKPAGMKDTYFFTELVGLYPDNKQPDVHVRPGQEYLDIQPVKEAVSVPIARGHWKGGSLAQYDRLDGILGDKGVYSTAEDLVRWTNAFFIDYKILPKEYVDEASKMQNKTSNGTIPRDLYGYGLHLEKSRDHGFLVFHGGLWNGFHNLWLYRPKDGVQIIFLSNYYNASHPGQSKLLLDLFNNAKKI